MPVTGKYRKTSKYYHYGLSMHMKCIFDENVLKDSIELKINAFVAECDLFYVMVPIDQLYLFSWEYLDNKYIYVQFHANKLAC